MSWTAMKPVARAGVGELGPDLGQPMSPTQYFQPDALRKLIREGELVREGALALSGDTGITAIRDLILAGPIVQPDATRLEPGDEIKVSVENLGTLSVKLST